MPRRSLHPIWSRQVKCHAGGSKWYWIEGGGHAYESASVGFGESARGFFGTATWEAALNEAKKVVEKMKAVAETKAIAPMAFAWAYTGMGDIDNAVAALEEAYQQRDYGAIFIRVPEFYEVLSPDPRYHAILRKMGLESE